MIAGADTLLIIVTTPLQGRLQYYAARHFATGA